MSVQRHVPFIEARSEIGHIRCVKEDERKSIVIIEHLDAAVESFERALAHKDAASRQAHLRSALYHWFAVMYDEGRAYRFDLVSSVATLSEQVSRLKQVNQDLVKLLGKARRK